MEHLFETGEIWRYLAGAAAMASVFYAALPFLDRAETNDRVRQVVIERRRSLAAEQRDRLNGKQAEGLGNAADALGELFRLEKLAGQTSAREMLMAAGFRRPSAAIIFLVARIVAPVLFAILAFLYLGVMEKPLAATLKMIVVLAAAAFGFALPFLIVKNYAQKRRDELSQHFPDALDLMLVCVEGGLSVEAAINRVADETTEKSPVVAEELGLLSAELTFLTERAAAFRNFANRTGEASTRTFANTLIQAERYGTSLSGALRSLASDLRDQRMQKAERKAAALPAQLTVPMIGFFMPGLFIVILGPAFITAMAAMK